MQDHQALSFIVIFEAIALEGTSGLATRLATVITTYLAANNGCLQGTW
ncbi:MAG: hypothetical protein O7D33_05925 [Chloroflexi bacterium]|nr:hypothetical protein [Chloroflexota bacterium]